MRRFNFWMVMLIVAAVGIGIAPQADAFLQLNILGSEDPGTGTGAGGLATPIPDVVNIFWPTSILDTNGDGILDSDPTTWDIGTTPTEDGTDTDNVSATVYVRLNWGMELCAPYEVPFHLTVTLQ